ncbi:hypothetical protein G6F57_022430 [Rhizopus arrhizus]|nr:hypothetical protein G6F57_022430 [Rhizopus arrhizus]
MDIVAGAVGAHQRAGAQVGFDQRMRQPGQAKTLARHRVQGIGQIGFIHGLQQRHHAKPAQAVMQDAAQRHAVRPGLSILA